MEQLSEYTPHHKMRQLIKDNNLLLMTISRFDIAYGFGDKSVRDVCRANNIDEDTFLAVCNFLSGKNYQPYPISLQSLVAYLKRAHLSFLDFTLPKIRHNLIDAINYSASDDVAFQLIKFYDDYVVEATGHIEYENNIIFGYIEKLLQGTIDEDFNISGFSDHHTHMATKLKDLKDVFISHYKQKDNIRLSSVLFDIIVCERDFMSHYEVECSLLIPEIKRLEKTLRSRLNDATDAEDVDDSEQDPRLATLSNREKDIIRLIAKGMANKEIADDLCLSVHTVATHRRNLCSKLEIHSTAGIIIFAILHHLVDIEEVLP